MPYQLDVHARTEKKCLYTITPVILQENLHDCSTALKALKFRTGQRTPKSEDKKRRGAEGGGEGGILSFWGGLCVAVLIRVPDVLHIIRQRPRLVANERRCLQPAGKRGIDLLEHSVHGRLHTTTRGPGGEHSRITG